MSNPRVSPQVYRWTKDYRDAHHQKGLSKAQLKQKLLAEIEAAFEEQPYEEHEDDKKKSEIDSSRSNEYDKVVKEKEEQRMENQGFPDADSQMSKNIPLRRNLSQDVRHLRHNYYFARSRPKFNLNKQSKSSNMIDRSLQSSQNQSGKNSRQIKKIRSLKEIPLDFSQRHDSYANPTFFRPKITKNEKQLALKGGQSKLKRMNRNYMQRKAIQRQAPPHAIYQQPKDKTRQKKEALWHSSANMLRLTCISGKTSVSSCLTSKLGDIVRKKLAQDHH